MASTELGSADAFMAKPILMQREAAMSRFGVRGLDGTSRQHRDQMRAIFGAAVQVAVQSLGGHGQTLEHLVRGTLLQNLFEPREAEHPFRARARYGDAHLRRPLG